MDETAIEHNLKLYQEWKDKIDDPRNWYGALAHFRCVECGAYCTFQNFRFFGNDPEDVRCWECQKR